MSDIKVGDLVRIGVYVCGEFRPTSLAVITKDIDASLCEVDKMPLHGGAAWKTIEQKSHLRKEKVKEKHEVQTR